MKMVTSLLIPLLFSALFVLAESLIITNGETLELGGSYSYDSVLISNGTIYLTNDTVISSSGNIQILSGGTITWHYTTTNWSTNIYLDSHGLGGSGASVFAKNGNNAWNMTLQAMSNLIIAGKIDLRGGAGQTHIGNAAQGGYGGYSGTGGTGGSSYGGNGGNGAVITLKSLLGNIDIQNANINFFGGSGGNGGDGGTGGEGGSPASGQGADGGNGGNSRGGNGGNGGRLIIRTKILYTNGWTYLMGGGSNGLAGSGGEGGIPGMGSWGSSSAGEITIFASGGPWYGSRGSDGQSYDGLPGTSGTIDVIKQAEAKPRFENAQISLGLDMTSTSATYTVECCTNLFTADWQPVGTFLGQGSHANWTGTLSNGCDKAFYRIQTTY